MFSQIISQEQALKVVDPRTPNIKAKYLQEVPIKETSIYPCPILQFRPVQKLKIEPKETFYSYSRKSHNMKRSIPKEEQKDIDNIIYQYEQLTRKPNSPIRSLERETSPFKKSQLTLNFAKTMLKRSEKNVQSQEGFGINTIKEERQTQLKQVLESQKPIQKRPKTAKINKKKKAKKHTYDSESGESIGEKIEPFKTQLVGIDIDQSQFKYFKPWLQESKLPKWAEDLQDKPLEQILNSDQHAKDFLNSMRKKKTIDIGPDQYDPSLWKVKIPPGQKQKSSKDSALLEQENKVINSQEQDRRIVQIYSKFVKAFDDYRDKIDDGKLEWDQHFDPKAVREKLQQKYNQNISQKEKVKEQDVNDLDINLINKATEFEAKVINIEKNIQYAEENEINQIQDEFKGQDHENTEIVESMQDDETENFFEEDETEMMGDQGFEQQNFQYDQEQQIQEGVKEDDENIFMEDEVEKIPKKLLKELQKNEIIIERHDQEQQVWNEIREEELKKQKEIDDQNKKQEEQEVKEYFDTRSAFARQFEDIVAKEFAKCKNIIALDLVYEDEKKKQDEEAAERERLRLEEVERLKAFEKKNYVLENQMKREKQVNRLLGQKLNKEPAYLRKMKQGESDMPKKSFMNTKIDNWIDNFEKNQKQQELIDKIIINDHLENQKEVKQTLKEFEEIMDYFENNGKYKKQMDELVRKYEGYQTQSQEEIIQSSLKLAEEEQFNFVNAPIKSIKKKEQINVDLSIVMNNPGEMITSGSRTSIYNKIGMPQRLLPTDQDEQNLSENEGGFESPFVLTPTKIQKLSIPLVSNNDNDEDLEGNFD